MSNMIRSLILITVGILLFGCSKPVEENTEAVAVYEDDLFRVELFSLKDTYKPNEEVEIYGTIEYIGKNDSITIYSGSPYMGYSVVDADGTTYIEFGQLLLLMETELEKGVVYKHPLIKSGGWSEDQEDASIWKSFYEEEKMLFPKGEYTLVFQSGFGMSEKGSYPINLEYEFEVR